MKNNSMDSDAINSSIISIGISGDKTNNQSPFGDKPSEKQVNIWQWHLEGQIGWT